MANMQVFSRPRRRSSLKRQVWIIVSFFCFFLVFAYTLPPEKYNFCWNMFSTSCKSAFPVPTFSVKENSDQEMASRVVTREILNPVHYSKNPKIAFMFLIKDSLPFETLWDKFFYVSWGRISIVDAERRLLANALKDRDNLHFVLLSESCIPLHNFDYAYDYLINANLSFIDCYEDVGPHGNGRYSEKMLPEIQLKDFRKGTQWFTMKRQHAVIVVADNLYYSKFRDHCQRRGEGSINCISDEHYLPTFLRLIDPRGIANRSVTHVDWSERKWHPKSYTADDVSYQLLNNISSIEQIELQLSDHEVN
ncbi:Core-2/I-branching beta-1,6-N-acetylglucosaminyltransferase family protein [Melia azedarach]|uniref:Core-2/I-branching beta-1,6-N-acetylglucosaminyltransferase family protein n=1 Tax=Melia azedarach TaxID=155640 RepID=A0ACC1XDQ8_MELAZ|nr:Core-2/I-branching beta-1,6-N-acetylglucosaminyltransferase family protein [Melia azedarach]